MTKPVAVFFPLSFKCDVILPLLLVLGLHNQSGTVKQCYVAPAARRSVAPAARMRLSRSVRRHQMLLM
jgi:hypothetical protein